MEVLSLLPLRLLVRFDRLMQRLQEWTILGSNAHVPALYSRFQVANPATFC